ncbi:TetR/AcrR family transcriptional regulator [Mycobacterium sp. 21AC1]|uniref:TetR/AcrR family transcriptional regulator n=1 Tax=[Mycobacterium] appelbergii TaxID=2939269 RepID=UPI0029395153|nr:TetR/AcrR family transcriptional regulator [Mycobacterium sp. 21AC1]MDV3125926.1 TetR/AcrR family transcriptional regulator [Mycobacterium sp. 21AC1]
MRTDQAQPDAPTVDPSRRELLLEVAADLFLRHPYDSVTVQMICAKAGISGPGLYRHFQNKQALLIAVVETSLESLHQFARATAEAEPDPRAALNAMVDFHIRTVLVGPPTPLIFLKNEHAFPESDRRRIRREMNLYAEEWISTVSQLRPELSEPEVRLLTHAVFSMLNAVATLNKGLDHDSIIKTMSTAAIQALTSPRAE